MSNIEILSTANDWINDGHKVAIATVLKTWGSAPRRAGSQLAIRDDGHMIGSVSGGCVEGERHNLASPQPRAPQHGCVCLFSRSPRHRGLG